MESAIIENSERVNFLFRTEISGAVVWIFVPFCKRHNFFSFTNRDLSIFWIFLCFLNFGRKKAGTRVLGAHFFPTMAGVLKESVKVFILLLLISSAVPPLSLCHLYSSSPVLVPSLFFLFLPSLCTLYVSMRAEYTTNANSVQNPHPHRYHTDNHNIQSRGSELNEQCPFFVCLFGCRPLGFEPPKN